MDTSGSSFSSSLSRPPVLRRTRFVCVSDTHNCTFKLPKGDVLIHAGDLTDKGTYSEVIRPLPPLHSVIYISHWPIQPREAL